MKMKQRHIQSFLMVSAAFFAISAPAGARASQSPFEASNVKHVAQVRTASVRADAGTRCSADRNEDGKAG
jgi:uncharacterized low-complexity protein